MPRLRSARMSSTEGSATLVSQVDDYIGELETEICEIFGFTLDTDITATAFGCNNAGQLTKQLIAWKGLKPIGLDITNSTNSKITSVARFNALDTDSGTTKSVIGFYPHPIEARLDDTIPETDFNETYAGFLLVEQTHTVPDPSWRLVGYVVTSAAQGLVPIGPNTVSQHLRGDGRFEVVGRQSELCRLATPVNSGLGDAINSGVTYTLSWLEETFDDNSMHALNASNVVIATTGRYHASLCIDVRDISQNGYVTLTIWRNRAAVLTQWGGTTVAAVTSAALSYATCEAVIDCVAADELYATVNYTTSHVGADPVTLADDGSFSVVRLS